MEYTVKYQHVEPPVQAVTFNGQRLILRGTLAWFFRLFKTMDCEDAAIMELYPWLMAELKRSNEKATLAPANVAHHPENGATQLS